MKTSTSGIMVELSDDEIKSATELDNTVMDLIVKMGELTHDLGDKVDCKIDFGKGNEFGFREMKTVVDFIQCIGIKDKFQIRTY